MNEEGFDSCRSKLHRAVHDACSSAESALKASACDTSYAVPFVEVQLAQLGMGVKVRHNIS